MGRHDSTNFFWPTACAVTNVKMGIFYNIPHGYQLTQALCHFFNTVLPKGFELSQATIVTPNQNNAFYIKQAYLEHIQNSKHPAFLPKIISLKSLIHEKVLFTNTLPNNVVTGFEKLAWIQNCLTEFFPNFKVSQKLQMAQSLLEVIDELLKNNVHTKKLESLKSHVTSDKWHNSLDILIHVYNGWKSFLKNNNKLEEYTYYETALNQLLQTLPTTYANTPFVFIGLKSNDYSQTSASWLNFINQVLNLPQGYVVSEDYFEGLNQYIPDQLFLKTDQAHEIAFPSTPDELQKQRNLLVKKAFLNIAAPTANSNLPTMLEQSTIYDEAKMIALIVRYHLHTKSQVISIITKNQKLATIIEGELDRWKIIVNNSVGIAFNKTVTGVFLRLLGNLWADQSYLAVTELLKHPLCLKNHRQDTLKLVRFLDLKILRSSQFVTQSLFKADALLPTALKQIWQKFLNTIMPILNQTASNCLTDFINTHKSVAEQLIGQDFGDTADSLSASIFFEEIKKFSQEYKNIESSDYPYVFDALIKKLNPVYFEKVTNSNVRILRPDEAIYHASDVTIMAGLNENSWPNLKTNDQWLSYGMRTLLGMPNALSDAKEDQHHFCHLFGVPNLYLTRCHMDDQKPTTPSRFWRFIQHALGKNYQSSIPWQNWFKSAYFNEEKKITIAPPVVNPPHQIRPKKLSATEVELLIRDPYGLYIKRCLNLKPLNPISLQITPSQKGQIFHEILHLYICQHPSPPFFEQDLNNLAKNILKPLKNIDPYLHFLMLNKMQKISAYTANYLNIKNSRHILTETKGQCILHCENDPIILYAMADRIDIATNSIDIIDYKNGTPPSFKKVEELFSPQLLIEALLWCKGSFYKKDSIGSIKVSYWHLKSNNVGVNVSSLNVNNDVLQQVELKLTALFNTMLCQNTPLMACPSPNIIATYHPYKHLERLDEWVMCSV